MGLSHHFWKIPLLSVFALGRICSFISVFVGYTPCGHLRTEGCARAGLFQPDSSLDVYCNTNVWGWFGFSVFKKRIVSYAHEVAFI